MKNQALFSSKDKSKNLKCRLLQYLFGTLRVNIYIYIPSPGTLGLITILLCTLSFMSCISMKEVFA